MAIFKIFVLAIILQSTADGEFLTVHVHNGTEKGLLTCTSKHRIIRIPYKYTATEKVTRPGPYLIQL